MNTQPTTDNVLALPWVLAEPEPVRPAAEPSPARQLPAAVPAEPERSSRVDWAGLALALAMAAAALVLYVLPVFDLAWQRAAFAFPMLAMAAATVKHTQPWPRVRIEHRAFWFFVACSVVWCIAALALFLVGVLTPVSGNVTFYLLAMAGLVCVALVAVTCPRPVEEHEPFWTYDSETHIYHHGQCTPSRQTLTGR